MQRFERYTEILRGKDAENNQKILKTLAQNRNPMNVTELTKSYLPKSKRDNRYCKEFSSLNSVIFRRVQALANLGYLEKDENKKFQLSLKAYLLACLLFPDITRFIQVRTDEDIQPEILGTTLTNQFYSEALTEQMLLRPFEKLLSKGQLNLDIASEEEMLRLIDKEYKESAFDGSIIEKDELAPEQIDVLIEWLETEKKKIDEKLAVARRLKEVSKGKS